MKGGWCGPLNLSPAWADFSIMMECCTSYSGLCHSVYSVDFYPHLCTTSSDVLSTFLFGVKHSCLSVLCLQRHVNLFQISISLSSAIADGHIPLFATVSLFVWTAYSVHTCGRVRRAKNPPDVLAVEIGKSGIIRIAVVVQSLISKFYICRIYIRASQRGETCYFLGL